MCPYTNDEIVHVGLIRFIVIGFSQDRIQKLLMLNYLKACPIVASS